MTRCRVEDFSPAYQEQIKRQLNLPSKPSHNDDEMNGTEKEYLKMLKGREVSGIIDNIKIKAIKFRVGKERCNYTPDFTCYNLKTGRIEVHEVKGGFYRDDARVKFQGCKLMYPEFDWMWCQKKEGVWTVE